MAALKNWKRPSMDELPAPTVPYVQVLIYLIMFKEKPNDSIGTPLLIWSINHKPN